MVECWQFLGFQPNTSMFTSLQPLYGRRSERHTSVLRAGIRFGSTCPPQREKPAGKKANGSAAWQDPHPRLNGMLGLEHSQD